MKILHISDNSNGYEKVVLLANKVNQRNGLAVIEIKGEKHCTGGLLLENTEFIRKVLDAIPRNKQYEFVKSFKAVPFVKSYYEE